MAQCFSIGFIGHQDPETQKLAFQSGTRVFTNPEEIYFPHLQWLIRHYEVSKAPWLSQPGCQVLQLAGPFLMTKKIYFDNSELGNSLLCHKFRIIA